MNYAQRRQSGFTLIEILIVVVILGILAGIVGLQLSGLSDDANLSATKTQVSSVRSAIDAYRVKSGGTYPSAATADVANLFTTALVPKYMKAAPNNPFTGSQTVALAASADSDTGYVYRINGSGVAEFHAVIPVAKAALFELTEVDGTTAAITAGKYSDSFFVVANP